MKFSMFDRIMTELMSKGKSSQKKHFQVNAKEFLTLLISEY